MDNETELARLTKNYGVARWISYGLASVCVLLIVTDGDLIPQKFFVTVAVFALGITASIYSGTIKRKIQNLEYLALTEAVEKAQIESLEAGIKNSTTKSRAAKAMSGSDVSNPAASLEDLPQSSDPSIRALVTMEAIDQQVELAKLNEKNMTLRANVCLSIGVFSGIAAFVLPLGACAQVAATTTGHPLSGLGAGLTAFFTVLVVCVGVGVAFGIAAATFRSRSRAAGNRLHELKMQGIRVKASHPTKN
jgi:hypothetical protein